MQEFSEISPYEEAASEAVELANRLAGQDEGADPSDIADGLLAGAVHYWLYSRQPCGNPACEDCAGFSTSRERVEELISLIREFAETSDYYHSPYDSDVGRA